MEAALSLSLSLSTHTHLCAELPPRRRVLALCAEDFLQGLGGRFGEDGLDERRIVPLRAAARAPRRARLPRASQ